MSINSFTSKLRPGVFHIGASQYLYQGGSRDGKMRANLSTGHSGFVVVATMLLLAGATVYLYSPPVANAVKVLPMGIPDHLASTAATPAAGSSFNGVEYCNDGSYGGQQKLSIWYPTSGFSSSMPSILWIHGGGWKQGNGPNGGALPESPAFPTAQLLASGFAIVSINYRLAPTYVYPAQEYDAQCAVAFLKNNADQLLLNPSEIDVSGASAGAHLASWVGVNHTALYSVAAVGVISAPEDLTSPDNFGTNVFTGTVEQAFPTAQARQAGSPALSVSPGLPPFLLEQGYNDTVVAYSNAVEMAQNLHAAGDSVWLVLVTCSGHGLKPLSNDSSCMPSPSLTETSNDLLTFFESHP